MYCAALFASGEKLGLMELGHACSRLVGVRGAGTARWWRGAGSAVLGWS